MANHQLFRFNQGPEELNISMATDLMTGPRVRRFRRKPSREKCRRLLGSMPALTLQMHAIVHAKLSSIFLSDDPPISSSFAHEQI